MYDLIYIMTEYEDMTDNELRKGFFPHIQPVYDVLITCIDERGRFIDPQTSKFQGAATRIQRNKPHNVYNIFSYVAKEVIDILLETKQEFEMKQRDQYWSNQQPRYV